ncbi:MAG: ZIP family metal transporter, partial [Candidatus Omnitrophica bacterium]|nr:ZIP family metal transporter [Candidatus Omnitrophota bacterium]
LTLHNIPEGLAIGTAIGVLSIEGITFSALAQTLALVLGIGIQNIPEGFAVSVSLHREGVSRLRSFWYGQLSGIVEPLAGVLGFLAVSWMRKILVFAMSFAAGAMIFVVVEEVIAESQRNRNTDLATLGTILGFLLMMILDLAFT